MFVLDTHALILYLSGSPSLGAFVESVLDDPAAELVLPAIAYAEALWILQHRSLGVSPEALTKVVLGDARITVQPLTQELVELATSLTGVSEMHDRQIAASAKALGAVLLTKDANIMASGVVECRW